MRRKESAPATLRVRSAARFGLALSSGVACLGIGLSLARSDEPAKKIEKTEACEAACGDCAAPDKAAIARGQEIFNREWIPSDPRSHGGDGLGPVYNDSSCVACHNMGGPGGGGPNSKNIDILAASLNQPAVQQIQKPDGKFETVRTKVDIEPLAKLHSGFRFGRTVVLHRFGVDPNYQAWRQQIASNGSPNNNVAFLGAFQAFEPAAVEPTQRLKEVELSGTIQQLPNVSTRLVAESQDLLIVANQAGAAGGFQQVPRATLGFINQGMNPSGITQIGQFNVRRSQRSPSALFGIGLIDGISEKDILANAEKNSNPATKGRPARMKDGRVGRFGWKGQIASVEDFVLNACANEVGLEVPGVHQALIPQAPEYKPGGMDLTRGECDDLIAFVKSIPAPAHRAGASAIETAMLKEGKDLLASVGCTNCHSAKVGNVDAIYSDLLLHDMGPELADAGSYGDPGSDPSDGDDDPFGPASQTMAAADLQPVAPAGATEAPAPAATVEPPPATVRPQLAQTGSQPEQPQQPKLPKGALRQEWRTPPLWGFRDSGPYLHDGRAQTLDQAVAMHGGQGSTASQAFFGLSPKDRGKIEVYLKSLAAPAAVELARAEK